MGCCDIYEEKEEKELKRGIKKNSNKIRDLEWKMEREKEW